MAPSSTVLTVDVRPDLAAAHSAVLNAVARPGACWSAEARTAMAAEVRSARAQPDRPPWEAPSLDSTLFVPDGPLPAAAVDAVWRITNHPGTLTADWYEMIVAGLPSPYHYVELVGLVAVINAVDRFADHLDLERLPVDEPSKDQPTGEWVEAEVDRHWVPTVEAKGSNVLRALSAVPDVQRLRAVVSEAQYVPRDALLGDLDWSRGTIDRRQIELIAAQTSKRNECFY
jgi:hypothetical protein